MATFTCVRRILRGVAGLLVMTVVVFAIGCADTVVAPERTNPLDPAAPNFRPKPAAPLVVEARDQVVHLSWQRPASEFVTSVRVERANSGEEYLLLAELPADSTRFVDSLGPFSSSTNYRITAVSDVGAGEKLNVGGAVWLETGRFSRLEIDSVATHTVRLSWTMISGLATHVRVLRQEAGAWMLVETLPASVSAAEVPIDVRSTSTPHFRVELAHESDLDVGLAGRSVSINLLQHLAPQRVTAHYVDEARVELAWENVLDIATSIGIYRSRDTGLPQRIGTVDPSIAEFVDETPLMNETFHRYSIRAEFDGGHTPFSHSELVEQRIDVPVIRHIAKEGTSEVVLTLGPTPRAREHIVRRSVDGGLFEEIARRPPTGGEFTDRLPAGASRLTYEVRTLASGGRLLRLMKGQGLIPHHTLEMNAVRVSGISFSHDGRFVAAATNDFSTTSRLRIFDLSSGARFHETRRGRYTAVAFLRNGDLLASWIEDGGHMSLGRTTLHHAESWQIRWQRDAGFESMREFNTSDDLLATPIMGRVQVLNPETGALVRHLLDDRHNSAGIGKKRAALAPDDSRLWIGSPHFGSYFEEWHVSSNTRVRTPAIYNLTVQHDASPDGMLVSAQALSSTTVLSTQSLQEVHRLPIREASFVGPYSHLMVGHRVDSIVISDLDNGTNALYRVSDDPEVTAYVSAVAASPDGRFVAAGSAGGQVRVYRVSESPVWFEELPTGPQW